MFLKRYFPELTKFTLIITLSLLLLGQGFGQDVISDPFTQVTGIQDADIQDIGEELELYMNASWQSNQVYVQTFPIGDYIPITGFVNRNAYMYLYVIYPNDVVRLNYPKTYDPKTTDNVVWGAQGQSFVRFVPTANIEGLWTFVLVATLEPLEFEELATFDKPWKLVDPIFSTPWAKVEVRQARVSKGATVSQMAKDASALWPHFQYVRANDLFDE